MTSRPTLTVLTCWRQVQQPSQNCNAGPLHSWPATFLQGNAAAAGTALINSLGALGGFIGPSLIGFLADDNDEDDYGAAMMAVGIFMMCAAVLMLGNEVLIVCSDLLQGTYLSAATMTKSVLPYKVLLPVFIATTASLYCEQSNYEQQLLSNYLCLVCLQASQSLQFLR